MRSWLVLANVAWQIHKELLREPVWPQCFSAGVSLALFLSNMLACVNAIHRSHANSARLLGHGYKVRLIEHLSML